MPIYWAFLLIALLYPNSNLHYPSFVFEGADKLVHFILFLLLGGIIQLAFPRQNFWLIFQILLLTAAGTEILQDVMHLGRDMDFWDLIADMIGGIVGVEVARRCILTKK